jgi:TusA-related sulfurtransferase
VSISIVEEEVEDKDKMTVVTVLREAKKLKRGEIIELITTFLPAPGIDSMRSKGYSVWTMKDEGNTIRTYFLKHQD